MLQKKPAGGGRLLKLCLQRRLQHMLFMQHPRRKHAQSQRQRQHDGKPGGGVGKRHKMCIRDRSKNPNYVGGWDTSKIVSDTITLLLFEDSSAAYAAYNSGEAPLVKDVPTDEIPSLTRAEDGGDFYLCLLYTSPKNTAWTSPWVCSTSTT